MTVVVLIRSSQRRQSWKPSPDATAILVIFLSEAPSRNRFFETYHGQMHADREYTCDKKVGTAKSILRQLADRAPPPLANPQSDSVTNDQPERCINVSTSGLVTTYPSTPSVTAGAVEQSSLTVSALFDLHANGLYRLALAMLHEADAAQDVVQDTFVRLIAHLEGG